MDKFMKKRKRKFTPLQIAAHIGSWIPLAWWFFDFYLGNLGPDIIRESILRSGKAALILLVLSLTCTPIKIIFKYNPVLKLRRPLGLYSFMYASIHFAIFFGVDYFFNFALIKDALFEKRYALVGLATGLILFALAITANDASKRRLRKNWTRLHKLAYAAGVLAVLHFIWLVKQGVSEPWIWGIIVALLLVVRVPPIKRFFSRRHNKLVIFKKEASQRL
jgi:sulfoxide reductase heme-binding subunit YedZ